jgi:hypothetical protein
VNCVNVHSSEFTFLLDERSIAFPLMRNVTSSNLDVINAHFNEIDFAQNTPFSLNEPSLHDISQSPHETFDDPQIIHKHASEISVFRWHSRHLRNFGSPSRKIRLD